MNDTGSVLVAHCGSQKVTREQLKDLPIPEATRSHQPLSHFEIVEVLDEALSFRSLNICKDEYAVSNDGMKMFGVMDLRFGFDGGRFSIGIRNSNDKSMRLALTAGYRVFVCDNMAFSGDFAPLLHKHTKNLDLSDAISIAVDRIHRGFGQLELRVKEMKELGLTDNDARVLIYRAFLEKSIKGVPRNLMGEVHNLYFNPDHEAFKPRNLWSLSNAFTSAFKLLGPLKRFEATARLGSFIREVQDDLKQRPEELMTHESDEDFYPFAEDELEEESEAELKQQPTRNGLNRPMLAKLQPVQNKPSSIQESPETLASKTRVEIEPLEIKDNEPEKKEVEGMDDEDLAEILANYDDYYEDEDFYHQQEEAEEMIEEYAQKMAA